MKYRELTKRLKQLGCNEVPTKKGGSHRMWENPSQEKEASIPDWRGKDLKTGTLRGILRKLGINYKDFRDS